MGTERIDSRLGIFQKPMILCAADLPVCPFEERIQGNQGADEERLSHKFISPGPDHAEGVVVTRRSFLNGCGQHT